MTFTGFCIKHDDSQAFARLSGDFNPLHLDSLHARRSPFGTTVVHGVHALLKALDALAEARQKPLWLRSLRAQFGSPISTGVLFESGVAATAQKLTLTISTVQGLAQRIVIEDAEPGTGDGSLPNLGYQVSEPEVVDFHEAAGRSGSFPLVCHATTARRLFPSLTRFMPVGHLAMLLASSKIVGMHCPGLHSLYTGLEINFTRLARADTISYDATEVDDRFRSCEIAIDSSCARGRLQVMFRPEPATQESFEELRMRVPPDRFARQRALVIGGSRGLGETTAKLIAAGGGSVWIGYAQGSSDAARVAEEIRKHGGSAHCLAFDVLQPPEALPDDWRSQPPTHVYYFATPHIPFNRTRVWDETAFQELASYYVRAFERTVRKLLELDPGPSVIFYPSTVLLDQIEQGAAEYVCAKSAGEALCRYLGFTNPCVQFKINRLPRMLTDQTSVIGPVRHELADAPEVLLKAIETLDETPKELAVNCHNC
jgi:hypothetical protein